MAIAKMSMKNNSFRYFKLAVNEYNNGCMSGVLYHAGQLPGIQFKNYLEVMLCMNCIFDELAYPKKTMDYRKFKGIDFPKPSVQECWSMEEGKAATFSIHVEYRYHASWQGTITWLEGQESQKFESFLQMTYWIERILSCPGEKSMEDMASNVCQIAVDSFEGGLMAGSVQNAFLNYLEEFTGIIALADAMRHIADAGSLKADDLTGQSEEIRIIPNNMWTAYREGGKKYTFLIRILFRQHSTWQGVIYWREKGEKQAFRSFMELILLIVSALECGTGKAGDEDNGYLGNRFEESVRLEG